MFMYIHLQDRLPSSFSPRPWPSPSAPAPQNGRRVQRSEGAAIGTAGSSGGRPPPTARAISARAPQ